MQISITILILTLYVIYILDTQEHSETAHYKVINVAVYLHQNKQWDHKNLS